jgi:hypothetical protein
MPMGIKFEASEAQQRVFCICDMPETLNVVPYVCDGGGCKRKFFFYYYTVLAVMKQRGEAK